MDTSALSHRCCGGSKQGREWRACKGKGGGGGLPAMKPTAVVLTTKALRRAFESCLAILLQPFTSCSHVLRRVPGTAALLLCRSCAAEKVACARPDYHVHE